MQKIENLKKIKLVLAAGTSHGVNNLQLPVSEFEFIFGLGSNGMSPLEYDLAEKTIDDEISVQLNRKTFPDYLMHLQLPIHGLFAELDSFYLTMRIDAIEQADNREVIKTMAEMASHGNGCGCGCGCGC
jgi:hypothetical protein